MPSFFCDAISVARIEFYRLQTVERGGNREAQMIAELIVALPAQGLAAGARRTRAGVRDERVKEGLLKPGDAVAARRCRPAKSPNFS